MCESGLLTKVHLPKKTPYKSNGIVYQGLLSSVAIHISVG